jgi:hypothetical protein
MWRVVTNTSILIDPRSTAAKLVAETDVTDSLAADRAPVAMFCKHSNDRFHVNGGIFPDKLRYCQSLNEGFDLRNKNAGEQLCASQCPGNSRANDHGESE